MLFVGLSTSGSVGGVCAKTAIRLELKRVAYTYKCFSLSLHVEEEEEGCQRVINNIKDGCSFHVAKIKSIWEALKMNSI